MALHRNGFIQTPQQSVWYALDTDFLQRFSLNAQKEEDSLDDSINNKSNPSLMHNLKSQFSFEQSNSVYKTQLNALYGYFLWNVGDTKVFCPSHVVIGEGGPNKREIQSACLVIDKKYIQLLPDVHLTE